MVFSIFLIIITVERKKLINFLVSIVIPLYKLFCTFRETKRKILQRFSEKKVQDSKLNLEKNNLKLKIIIGNITTKSYSFKIFNSYDRCT